MILSFNMQLQHSNVTGDSVSSDVNYQGEPMQLERSTKPLSLQPRKYKPTRNNKRRWGIFVSMSVLMLIVFALVQTRFFYSARYLLAEDLYSSQHRYLAKFLVPQDALYRIMYDFTHPSDINSFPGGFAGDTFASSATPAQINQAMRQITLHVDGFTAHEIIIRHPSWLQLQMTTSGPNGRGLTLREAMLHYHAIAGINAGGFNDPAGDGNGGTPIGLLIEQGHLLNPSSYLAGTNQVMGMTQGGEWFMGDYTATFMLTHHVQYAIQFGPELIVNDHVMVSGTDGWGYAPRTIIGQKADGSIVFWVNDGPWARGMVEMGPSPGQSSQILHQQGVVNAFNLDGGGSATMMIHRPYQLLALVNQPQTNNPPFGMRFLPDAFLVIPPPLK